MLYFYDNDLINTKDKKNTQKKMNLNKDMLATTSKN